MSITPNPAAGPVPTQIETVKRLTLDTPATLQGLLALVGNVPMEVPAHAEVVSIIQYTACPVEAHENPDLEHEPEEFLAATFEWVSE